MLSNEALTIECFHLPQSSHSKSVSAVSFKSSQPPEWCLLTLFSLSILSIGSPAMHQVDRWHVMWMYHHSRWGWTPELPQRCGCCFTYFYMLILHMTLQSWEVCTATAAAAASHQPDSARLIVAPLPASTIILLNNAEPSLLLHSVTVDSIKRTAMPSTC